MLAIIKRLEILPEMQGEIAKHLRCHGCQRTAFTKVVNCKEMCYRCCVEKATRFADNCVKMYSNTRVSDDVTVPVIKEVLERNKLSHTDVQEYLAKLQRLLHEKFLDTVPGARKAGLVEFGSWGENKLLNHGIRRSVARDGKWGDDLETDCPYCLESIKVEHWYGNVVKLKRAT